MPRNVYLVGSVPLADAGTVFETVSAALGPYLLTLPDGETGERLDWITWLEPVFAANPAFQLGGEIFQLHSGVNGRRRYGLRLGVSLEEIHFANLFYADIACRSFATFAALKLEGKLPERVKFQVDLVPAHSVLWLFVEENLQRDIDPIYNDAIIREIDKIVETIPHDQLAIRYCIRCVCPVRAQPAEPLWRNKGGDAGKFLDNCHSARRTGAGGRRSAVPLLLWRRWASPRGRAHRHGRHGGLRQQVGHAAQPADHANSHAGAARSY